MSEVAPTPETARSARRIGAGELGLIIAVIPIVLLATRVLIFSGGDPVVLRIVLGTLDIQTVLLGTVLPLIPTIALVVAFLLSNNLAFRGLFNRLVKGRPVIVAGLAILSGIALLTMSAPAQLITVGALVVGTIAGLITRRVTKQGSRPDRIIRGIAPYVIADSKAGTSSWLIVVSMVLLVAFLAPSGMWLPLEKVFAEGRWRVGYVLDVDNGWTTIIDRNRVVEVLPSAEITKRLVCDQNQYKSLITIYLALETPNDNPNCKPE